jgi:acetyltransferase-like isoleucine patch superfamily enzyme
MINDEPVVQRHSRSGSLFRLLRGAIGLGAIDSIGRGTVFAGRPDVSSDGSIIIGRDCYVGSRPIQSHLVVMPGARIVLGDRIVISYGAALAAAHAIEIGDDTRVGPFCVVLDHDYHKLGERNVPGVGAPVQIGRGVTIGARVTVLRGALIGDGARVLSGSTIVGIVAAGALVSGVPAIVKRMGVQRRSDPLVAAVVARVFGLAAAPDPLDGPGTIAAWNEIGAMRLLLALETSFGLTLSADRIRRASNVADVSRLVARARALAAVPAAIAPPSRGAQSV